MEREELMEILGGMEDRLLKKLQSEQAPPPPEQPKTNPPTGKNAELIAELMAAMDARNKTDAQMVYDTMFEEKVSSLTNQYPAFGEYLASEDDFGEVILDRIKRIDDYNKRVTAFDKVFKNFASAQSTKGQDMRLSKTVKKQVEDDDAQRGTLKEKFLKGEMNLADFTDKYFEMVQGQMGKLQGGN